MEMQRRKYSRLRVIIITAVALLLLWGGLHLYIVQSTKRWLQTFVTEQSHGAYRFTATRIKVNYWAGEVTAGRSVLMAVDTQSNEARYKITIQSTTVAVKSVFQAVFSNYTSISEISFNSPVIEIYDRSFSGDKKSVTTVLGNTYQQLEQVLEQLEVKNCNVNNARLVIHREPGSKEVPLKLEPADLTVKNFRKEEGEDSSQFFFTDDIIFKSGHQEIKGENGSFSLAGFSLSTKEKRLHFDSCRIDASYADTISGNYSILVPKLDLYNVDFKALYNGEIAVDSIICVNPDFYFRFSLGDGKLNPVSTRESINQFVSYLFGELNLNHIEMKNAAFRVEVQDKNQTRQFRAVQEQLVLNDIRVKPGELMPLHVGEIEFDIHNYHSASEDNRYVSSFDSIRVKDNNLIISNFRVRAAAKLANGRQNEVFVPQLRLIQIDLATLVLFQQLEVEIAIVENPVVTIYSGLAGKQTSGPLSLPDIFSAVKGKVDLKELRLQGATAHIIGRESQLTAEDVNGDIAFNALLETHEFSKLNDRFRSLSVARASYKTPRYQFELDAAAYEVERRVWLANGLHFTQPGLDIDASGLRLVNLMQTKADSSNGFRADSLSWQSGTFHVRTSSVKGGDAPALKLGVLRGGKTDFNFIDESGSVAKAALNKVSISGIEVNGQHYAINDFDLNGDSLSWNGADMSIRSQTFQLGKNRQSSIKDLLIQKLEKSDSLLIQSPNAKFNWNGEWSEDLHFRSLELDKPELLIASHSSAAKNDSSNLRLKIDELRLREPRITYRSEKNGQSNYFSSAGGEMAMQDLDYLAAAGKLGFDRIQLRTTFMDLNLDDSLKINSRSPFQLDVDSFRVGAGRWAGHLRLLDIIKGGIAVKRVEKSDLAFNDIAVHLEGLSMSSETENSVAAILRRTKQVELDNLNLSYQLAEHQLRITGASYDRLQDRIEADSISFIPLQDKASYFATVGIQKDYIQLSAGKLIVEGADLDQWLDDAVFRARKITIDAPHLDLAKDRRLPFVHGRLKPMLSVLIKELDLPMSIGTIALHNGQIVYHEFNPKTDRNAEVIITEVEGEINNVKNRALRQQDSLRIHLMGWLTDAAHLDLSYSASYQDSLSTGSMLLRSGSVDLVKLNPIVEPLAGARIEAGQLDTLVLESSLNDMLAKTKLTLQHRNLKISVLKTTGKNSQNERRGFLSLLANLFVKKDSRPRPGITYQARDRERFITNYWVKILINALQEAVGIGGNKKPEKWMEPYLGKLPPID